MEKIAVVNELDKIIAFREKLYVHQKAILHRAFSVILFNSNGEMLLQKRSAKKYHSPGLWTNACCSHELNIDKSIKNSANRRIFQELGLKGIELYEIGVIKYRCDFKDGLSENEIDHIFIGKYDGFVKYNSDEIDEIKWIDRDKLVKWVTESPEQFTYWFKLLVNKVLDLSNNFNSKL